MPGAEAGSRSEATEVPGGRMSEAHGPAATLKAIQRISAPNATLRLPRKGVGHLRSMFGKKGLFRSAVLALASAAALVAAPVAALAAGPYNIYVTASNGTLSGVSAVDANGTTVTGTVYSANEYVINESTPGPFAIVGTGTKSGSATTAEAVYLNESVTSATYSDNVSLTLPGFEPDQVTAPSSLSLTAGTSQTVAISVYNSVYGSVADGTPVMLTPSTGLALAPANGSEMQAGQSVYANTVGGAVYVTASGSTACSCTLTVATPSGATIGTIPVSVTTSSSVGGGGGGSGGGSSGGSPGPTGVGSTVTVDGVSGTIVLLATFDASQAQTLQTSDGAVQLKIPAGAIASSGTVTLQIVEFGQTSTGALLKSVSLAPYEQSLGLSYDFSATVNGTQIHTFNAPITALYSLSSVQAAVHDARKVDLMRVNSDNTLTYIGGKWNGTQVQVSMGGFTPYALMEVARTFPDIDNHWAKDDIELMASKFVVQGFPDGTFGPEGSVTRAQFTAMLLRMMNIPIDAKATVTFTDVPSTAWYYGVVATAAEKGIVQGYSSTSFGPDDLITREQLVTIFVRAAELQNWVKATDATTGQQQMTSTFSDTGQVDGWAQSSMAVAVANGLIKGRTPTTLVPLGLTTRAEAATWVSRLFQKFE